MRTFNLEDRVIFTGDHTDSNTEKYGQIGTVINIIFGPIARYTIKWDDSVKEEIGVFESDISKFMESSNIATALHRIYILNKNKKA